MQGLQCFSLYAKGFTPFLEFYRYLCGEEKLTKINVGVRNFMDFNLLVSDYTENIFLSNSHNIAVNFFLTEPEYFLTEDY